MILQKSCDRESLKRKLLVDLSKYYSNHLIRTHGKAAPTTKTKSTETDEKQQHSEML